MALECPEMMKYGQLMIDILVYVSCNFEMYIFNIAQIISENIRIAFFYVLSIFCFRSKEVISAQSGNEVHKFIPIKSTSPCHCFKLVS